MKCVGMPVVGQLMTVLLPHLTVFVTTYSINVDNGDYYCGIFIYF